MFCLGIGNPLGPGFGDALKVLPGQGVGNLLGLVAGDLLGSLEGDSLGSGVGGDFHFHLSLSPFLLSLGQAAVKGRLTEGQISLLFGKLWICSGPRGADKIKK